ncbi:MAG: response regulator transcription factor [Cryomorphaceae bacterium]|nr:response regulator transcription factor [Cryomorphaceae bacterium]
MSIIAEKKVIIIDDHKLFTDGLSSILESIGLRVMSTFQNGKEAVLYLQNNEIDIIFSDINMPEMDGLKLCKRLKRDKVKAKIIILSMYEDPNIIKEAFNCGASAYLSKNTEKKEIIKAIKKSLNNKKYVNKRLLKKKDREEEEEEDTFSLKYKLTLREREILQLLLDEENNRQIGEILNISIRTIETHRRNIMLKLDVKNNIGLIKKALSYQLFSKES